MQTKTKALFFALAVGVFFIALAFAPAGYAQKISYNAESTTMQINITSTISKTATGSNSYLKRAIIETSFFPREYYLQHIISQDITPKEKEKDGKITFEWNDPVPEKFSFSIKSVVVSENRQKEIKTKINFPYISEKYKKYTKPTATIDSDNKRIINIANQLAAGEDDYYAVVYKLGQWVNKNIKYDLNTITASATKKASWVLENREGVCDEITNLFLALCRSLNIPARFVSGVSYSNMEQFNNTWSGHGWAEVYFPGYGWIPFDITYGEFGYVDSTHIKLKDSVDATKPTTRYKWEGKNVDLNISGLKITTKELGQGKNISKTAAIEISFLDDKINLGSYNVMIIKIKNLLGYYNSQTLFLSKTDGLEIAEGYKTSVLLKPHEEKLIYYTLKLSNNLDKNYVYTFDISARAAGAEAEKKFSASEDYTYYSLDDVREYINDKKTESRKKYSKSITMKCSAEKNYVVNSIAKMSCLLKNTGNMPIVNMTICVENSADNVSLCKATVLNINSEKSEEFNISLSRPGQNDLTITAKAKGVLKKEHLRLNVFEKAEIDIENISYKRFVSFDKESQINITIKNLNKAPIKSATVTLIGKDIKKDWSIDNIDDRQKIIINIGKNTLWAEENNFTILLNYYDSQGKHYLKKETIIVHLKDITAGQRITLWLNYLTNDIKQIFVMLVIAVFFAGFTIGIIFYQRKTRNRRWLP